MKPLFIALVAACMLAPAAHADTFFVDDDAPAGNAACTLADPCDQIQEAVVEARASGSPPNTVDVAAGTYAQPDDKVSATDPADAGLTIEGDGADTVLSVGGVAETILADQADLGLFDLTIETPALPGQEAIAGGSTDPGSAWFLQNVDVQVPTGSTSAVRLTGTDNLVLLDSRITYGGAGEALAYNASGDNGGTPALLVMVDSEIAGTNPTPPSAMRLTDVSFILGRSEIRVPADAMAAVTLDSEEAFSTGSSIQSSLITGGVRGLDVYDEYTDVQVLHTTIDPGIVGERDPGPSSIVSSAPAGEVVVSDSILVAPGDQASGQDITCTRTDLPPSPLTPLCTPGSENNTDTAPASLFVGGADLHLKPDGPAVDTAAGGLAPGESPEDFDNNPRATDGDGDGVIITDRGAYESPAVAGPPSSSAAAAGPGTAPGAGAAALVPDREILDAPPACTLRPRATVLRSGALKVVVACPTSASVRVSGTVKVAGAGRRKARTQRLTTRSAVALGGKPTSMKLALPTEALRALENGRGVSVFLAATASGGGTPRGAATATATLKPPK